MIRLAVLALAAAAALPLISLPAHADCGFSILEHAEKPLDGGAAQDLCKAYGGKVVLVVNTAGRSPNVGQYADLEALYQRFKNRGFVVLAFPSNDFHDGSDDARKIAETIRKYGVTFPVFAPIHVTGPDTDPLYRDLFLQAGVPPFHDFDKYLISRQGDVVAYYNAGVSLRDASFTSAIESHLQQAP